MKVYVVRSGWDYEGSEVVGVADSIAAAKKLADREMCEGQAGRAWDGRTNAGRWRRTLAGGGHDWQDITRWEVEL